MEPNNPVLQASLHDAEGENFMAKTDFAAAAQAFRQATALQNDNVLYWQHLANAYRQGRSTLRPSGRIVSRCGLIQKTATLGSTWAGICASLKRMRRPSKSTRSRCGSSPIMSRGYSELGPGLASVRGGGRVAHRLPTGIISQSGRRRYQRQPRPELGLPGSLAGARHRLPAGDAALPEAILRGNLEHGVCCASWGFAGCGRPSRKRPRPPGRRRQSRATRRKFSSAIICWNWPANRTRIGRKLQPAPAEAIDFALFCTYTGHPAQSLPYFTHMLEDPLISKRAGRSGSPPP